MSREGGARTACHVFREAPQSPKRCSLVRPYSDYFLGRTIPLARSCFKTVQRRSDVGIDAYDKRQSFVYRLHTHGYTHAVPPVSPARGKITLGPRVMPENDRRAAVASAITQSDAMFLSIHAKPTLYATLWVSTSGACMVVTSGARGESSSELLSSSVRSPKNHCTPRPSIAQEARPADERDKVLRVVAVILPATCTPSQGKVGLHIHRLPTPGVPTPPEVQ